MCFHLSKNTIKEKTGMYSYWVSSSFFSLAEAAVIPVQLLFVISEFLVFGLSYLSKSSISQSVVLIGVALQSGAKQRSETWLV